MEKIINLDDYNQEVIVNDGSSIDCSENPTTATTLNPTPSPDTIIGIDLGTSTIEAAVIQAGKPVMIFNFDGELVTPSVVGIDHTGDFVVGSRAKAQYLLEPEKTAIEVKRMIGTDAKIKLGKESFTPVELSSMLLSYVKRFAEAFLELEINRAVISVPAYFNDLQRQATVEAGQKAGFMVDRIINEPTAAALSYGIEHLEEESHILVYDLGGGTFDVTLLEMFDGVLEVKASSGDNQLGGKDFDERLVNWMADQFYEKHKIKLLDDVFAAVKLKEQAELCKIKLSSQDSLEVKIPFIAEKDGVPLALEETVTLELFESLIADLILRTHEPIDVVLGDSGVGWSEIDKILLVGGSTRVPLVKKDIQSYTGIVPSSALNPDYAVAAGAAIQGGMISGAVSTQDSIMMTDVNPFTLGVQVLEEYNPDCMSVIIPRNVTIPVTKSQIYQTSFDYQDRAVINVYQGESRTASKNNFLGEFTVKGIPAKPQGVENLKVEFSYNLNGMLVVSAVIVSTGEKAFIEINMMEKNKTVEKIDVSGWKDSPNSKKYRMVIRRAEKLLKELAGDKIGKTIGLVLEELVYDLKKAIIDHDAVAEELEEDILDFLENCE